MKYVIISLLLVLQSFLAIENMLNVQPMPAKTNTDGKENQTDIPPMATKKAIDMFVNLFNLIYIVIANSSRAIVASLEYCLTSEA